MEESSTYRAICAREARKILLSLGTRRLGEPDEHTRAVIERAKHRRRVEQWVDRLEQVNSWAELLKPAARRTARRLRRSPGPSPRTPRRRETECGSTPP